ncbi:MAG: hypothetical protein HYU84_03335 [Chloroflexi bacterium]|nr:hypothetical protein [Chloroflexota bacterium]MBI3159539.1 hypothetical protein [Chloroflexota bacterium]
MAKIIESKGRADENSGYSRLFGNQALGQLISRVQATVIRTGNELEKLLKGEVPSDRVSTMDGVVRGFRISNNEIIFQAAMPRVADAPGAKADIVIVDHNARKLYLVELKDGDTFDTKKAAGELASMQKMATWLEEQVIGYQASIHFCSFNQDDKEAIVKGAKGRFSTANAMTGVELCILLGIDYDKLRKKREEEQPENLKYFVSELLKIPQVVALIRDYWKGEHE